MARGKGEGTIYKRPNGTWTAQATIGVKEDGRPDRVTIYGKTRGDVSTKLNKIINDIETGDYVKETRLTVKEWFDQWLDYYAGTSLKPKSIASYTNNVNKHIIPAFGGMKLASLTTDHIQRFVADKLETLSPKTVRYLHFILKNALEQAVNSKNLRHNPANGVRLPRKQVTTDILPLDPLEVNRLLEVSKGSTFYPLLVMALNTGMRRGELLALKWDNVDFENRVISIVESYVQVDGKGQLQDPKTEGSIAKLPMSDFLYETLLAHKEAQASAKKYARSVDLGLVFATRYGTYLPPRNVNRSFYKYRDLAGIRKVRFHDLRHTFAYMLILQNVNVKVVQELMRHTDIRTTMNVYGKLLPSVRSDAVSAIEAFFSTIPATTEEQPESPQPLN